MSGVHFALASTGGYALGSISFALLFARARGVDLRTVGSGNLGATNASRALGRGTGVLIYLLDALKGFLPAGVLFWTTHDPALAAAAGAGAFLGHVLPVWHGFRGGKGVATLSGALLALSPWTALAAGISLGATVLMTRMISAGSIAFGIVLGPAAWVLGEPRPIFLLAAFGGLLLVFTHRANIQRIRTGRESRIGERRAAAPPPEDQ
ncbi:MAG: glycerol-3-phosphate acyltransferase [Planctomycetota bacterium]|nr:glycerol-3-phosphate acyltransferase [Planctomycetota bacterium]